MNACVERNEALKNLFVPAEGICVGVCRIYLERALKESNGSVRFLLERKTVSDDTPCFRTELVDFGDLSAINNNIHER